MLFRVKVARPLPADRNRPNVINKRVDYATWSMNHAVMTLCFLWTDVATTSGCPEVAVERGRERGRTVKSAASEDET